MQFCNRRLLLAVLVTCACYALAPAQGAGGVVGTGPRALGHGAGGVSARAPVGAAVTPPFRQFGN